MSRRPTDWSPLVGCDPVPGDPDEIERAARSLTQVAEEIKSQAANLRRLSTAEGWDADAGRTFADSARDLAGRLEKAHGRYATSGGALRRYAPELRHAQSLADTALAEAKQAQHTIDANQPPAYPPSPEEASAERHRQYAYDDGISALRAAQRKLDEATGHRDEHAGRAARAIHESVENDGLKDSWWDKFTNWVHEHADLLTAIAKIAEEIATALSTLALLISWIPGLDFLAPVLLGLAALASLVALGCNLMLALAGEGSWLDVATDLFGVVTFGYGAKAGLALRAGEAAEGVAEDAVAAERGVAEDISGNIDRNAAKQTKNLRCEEDPVDVAAGRVVLTQTDVELAGVLPLVFSRTHLSSYRVGRWFGPSWASTLDQRLEIEDTGVYYAAKDGMLLAYPVPAEGTSVLPGKGPRWPLGRTQDGGYTITDPQRGHTLHFAPASAARGKTLPLRAITDRVGHRIDLGYAVDGMLTEVRHSGGYRIGVETTGGRITALRLRGTDPEVVLVRYGYDERGRLTEVTNSSGVPLHFDYDDAGRLTGWQDRNDVAYRYTYDESGRCVRTSGARGYLNGTFRYDLDEQVTVFTNALGAATTFQLNEHGQVVRETDPLGGSAVSVWDRYDRLLARTDPLGRTTHYTYDSAGNLVATTRPDGSQVRAVYNELHLPVTITTADGASWQRVYDEAGNLTAVIDPLGAATHYARDGFGRVSAITDPMGGVTRFGWTTEGKLAWRTLPDGATERWSYDSEGNLVEHLDALGQATHTEVGPFDLPTAQIGPDGARLEFRYDAELRLVSVTNPQGLLWCYDYDPAGNLIAETDFNRRELRYVHDAAGQLIERTNGAGQTTAFVRDLLGNVVEQRSGDAVATFGYDAAGRIIRATNADAELIFERDALGRVLAETCNGRTLTSGYDALGRCTHRRTPSGAESVWKYGAGDAPLVLRTGGHALRFDYDPAGREIQRHLDTAGAVLAQSWDANHRLISQTLTARQERLVQCRRYGYRPDGYVTTIEDHLSGLRRFDLDPAGRVTAVRGTAWSERYAYDPAGNITAAAWPVPSPNGSLDADARGEREYAGTLIRRAGTIRYQHDAQGRVVLRQQKRLSAKPRRWHYTWDADDRLIGAITPDGARWRYHYDPLGRRITKQRLESDGVGVAEQVYFTWNGTVLAEQTHTPGPGEPARTTTWDWEPDTFRPLTQTERTPLRDAPQERVDQQFYAIVTDLIGTPTEMLTPDGTLAWHPRTTLWGTTVTSGPDGASCPLRFPGQYHDPETALNYNYYRYYDPTTSRYHANDPIGLNGGPNPHTYVPNPATWLDPLGLLGCTKGPITWNPSNGPGPLGEDVAKTFRSATYTQETLERDTTLYRSYGGSAGPLGRFWSEIRPSGPLQSQIDSALNPAWGNTAESVSTIRVPAGTEVFKGFAAPQSLTDGGSLLGGGSQVYLPHVDPAWLVP